MTTDTGRKSQWKVSEGLILSASRIGDNMSGGASVDDPVSFQMEIVDDPISHTCTTLLHHRDILRESIKSITGARAELPTPDQSQLDDPKLNRRLQMLGTYMTPNFQFGDSDYLDSESEDKETDTDLKRVVFAELGMHSLLVELATRMLSVTRREGNLDLVEVCFRLIYISVKVRHFQVSRTEKRPGHSKLPLSRHW